MFSGEPFRRDEVTSRYATPQASVSRAALPRGTRLALEAQVEQSPFGYTIHLPVRAERVTVEKWPVVVEEVVVRTTQVDETAHLDESVRHEELHVDTVGDVQVTERRTDRPGVIWEREP